MQETSEDLQRVQEQNQHNVTLRVVSVLRAATERKGRKDGNKESESRAQEIFVLTQAQIEIFHIDLVWIDNILALQ